MFDGDPFDSRPNDEWQEAPLSRLQQLRSALIRLGLPAKLLLGFNEKQLTAIEDALVKTVVLPGVDPVPLLKDCISIDLTKGVAFHLKEFKQEDDKK